MKCKEVEPYLQSVVDKEAEEPIFKKVLHHLTHCSDCAQHLEQLKRLKAQVQKRLKTATAPAGLEQRIRAAIASEAPTETEAPAATPGATEREQIPRSRGWLGRLFALPAMRFASAVAALVIVAAISSQIFSPTTASGGNFLKKHAQRVVRCHIGNITGQRNPASPSLLSGNESELHAFLVANKVDYLAAFPSIPGCEIMGVSHPKYESRDVSCIMYGGKRKICFFSMRAKPTEIPDDCATTLDDGSRAFYERIEPEEKASSGSYGVLIWMKGDFYYSIVSDCGQNELRTYASEIRRQLT